MTRPTPKEAVPAIVRARWNTVDRPVGMPSLAKHPALVVSDFRAVKLVATKGFKQDILQPRQFNVRR